MTLKLVGLDDVQKKLADYERKMMRGVEIRVGAFAGQLESKAVKHAPWTDRTSIARNSITGSWSSQGGVIIVALAIGADYGKYLELSNGGRYRIIQPVVESSRQEFMSIPSKVHREII